MRTWKELENEFKELASKSSGSRIDLQWGYGGEHSITFGMSTGYTRERFIEFSRIAGRKVLELAETNIELPNGITAESDDYKRWCKVLWKMGKFIRADLPSYALSDEGEKVGTIYSGSIPEPAHASSIMCLRLELGEVEDSNSEEDVDPVITPRVWAGVVNVIKSKIADGSFGIDFPDECPDGNAVIGTNEFSMATAMEAEFPEITWPLVPEQTPPFETFIQVLQFCFRHIAHANRIDHHKFFSHHHLEFNRSPGQSDFAERLNRIFAANDMPIAFNNKGDMELIDIFVADVRKPESTSTVWQVVEREFEGITGALNSANSDRDFQAVGVRCREIFITIAQNVYDPSKHTTIDGTEPSKTDAKRMLEAYISTELKGQENEEHRKFARSAISLANSLTHKRTATKTIANLCLEAVLGTLSIITILQMGQQEEQGT